jgi:hypothetical protein
MEFQTRSKECALDALVARLATLGPNHPDRPKLMRTRTILGLRQILDAPSAARRPASGSRSLRSDGEDSAIA